MATFEANNRKPNIIIFNPDQMRSDALGCHGNPGAVTPFIDELVKNDAVSFSNAFCQNPVCTPSRCSFMSGWYPHVHGHRTMYHMLHPEHGDPNMLKVLRDNGYFIWWGGKNDLVPALDGYEDYCDVKYNPDPELLKSKGLTFQKGLHGTVKEWAARLEDNNSFSFFAGLLDKGDEELYCDEDWALVLGAIDFILNYNGDKPYCIFLPLLYPHPPYGVEEPYFSAIDREKLPARIQVPQNEDKPMILAEIRERQKMHDWTDEQWCELRAVYYGMCSRLDDQFRLLITALKDAGQYGDSVVFMLSDHGDFTGDYNLVEKNQNTFEDCLTNVPLIIKPPAGYKSKSGVNPALVELVDFAATVYDVCGIDVDYDHFGKSLLPLIAGEQKDIRNAVFCEGGRMKGEIQAMERESSSCQYSIESLYWPRQSLQISDEKPWHGKAVMCRTDKAKYVSRYYELDEFYDLENDPEERVNQINNPQYRDAIAAHKQLMLEWFIATCDVVPRNTDLRW